MISTVSYTEIVVQENLFFPAKKLLDEHWEEVF
jgi:hypothetical protein